MAKEMAIHFTANKSNVVASFATTIFANIAVMNETERKLFVEQLTVVSKAIETMKMTNSLFANRPSVYATETINDSLYALSSAANDYAAKVSLGLMKVLGVSEITFTNTFGTTIKYESVERFMKANGSIVWAELMTEITDSFAMLF